MTSRLDEALHPSTTLLIKLGSIVVHQQELASPGGHGFDKVVLDQLLADPEVQDWLDTMNRAAFLPVPRDRPHLQLEQVGEGPIQRSGNTTLDAYEEEDD